MNPKMESSILQLLNLKKQNQIYQKYYMDQYHMIQSSQKYIQSILDNTSQINLQKLEGKDDTLNFMQEDSDNQETPRNKPIQ